MEGGSDDEAPDIQKIQAELLKGKALVMKNLGLDELEANFTAVVTDAAKAARKRKLASASASAAAPIDTGFRRRSDRVKGVGPDGGSASLPTREVYVPPVSVDDHPALIGDVLWYESLDHTMDKTVARNLMDVLRRQAASSAGGPVPVPLPEIVGTSTESASASASTSAATSSASRIEDYAASVAWTTSTSAASSSSSSNSSSNSSSSSSGKFFKETRSPSRERAEVKSASSSSAAESSPSRRSTPSRSGKQASSSAPASSLPTSNSSSSSSATPSSRETGSHEKRAASKLCKTSLRSVSSVMKVMRDRIYSMAIHPSSDRVICFAGGKWGRLAVWCPDVDVRGEETDEYKPPRPPKASSSSSSSSSSSKRRRGGKEEGEDEEDEKEDEERDEEDAKALKSRSGGGKHTAAAAADDDDEDSFEHTVTNFWPHTAPINQFQVPLGAPHLLLSSSYDGTVRCLDLNKGVSWSLYETEREENGISAMDVHGVVADAASPIGVGAQLYVGTREGSIIALDLRSTATRPRPAASGRNPVSQFEGHDKKISAISSLANTHYLLSTGSDGYVKVWDSRRLPAPHISYASSAASSSSSSSKSSSAAAVKEVSLLTSTSGLTSTSAFFSHQGSRIVSTSNDNHLRVWDVRKDAGMLGLGISPLVSEKPSLVISHNNHTGRWISSFRTIFDPANDDTILVGNMERSLEIFSAKSIEGQSANKPLAALTSDMMTAIPTLNAVHPNPSINIMVSGTASGRAHLWT